MAELSLSCRKRGGSRIKLKPQSLLFLPKCIHLFLKKVFYWIVANLWLISGVLKKQDLTVSVNVLFAFMEKCYFWPSLVCYARSASPHSEILTLQILCKFWEMHRSIFINYILFSWRGMVIKLSKKHTRKFTSSFELQNILLITVHYWAQFLFSQHDGLISTLSQNWGDCDGFPRKNAQTLYTNSYYMNYLHLYLNLMFT